MQIEAIAELAEEIEAQAGTRQEVEALQSEYDNMVTDTKVPPLSFASFP